MGYHLFSIRTGIDEWWRTTQVLKEQEFYDVVDLVDGCVPFDMSAFHFDNVDALHRNRVMARRPVLELSVPALFSSMPCQAMKLKDKRLGRTLPIVRKYGDYVLTETEYGQRFWRVDGERCSIVTMLHPAPITLRAAAAYVDRHHRHNAGPKFHKFSAALTVPGEPEPVGVVIASTPKARYQMDGQTLEINRACADPRYADVCSKLYAMAIRAGRELGYQRFLTYTLPGESGSSLLAVGFRHQGETEGTGNWDSPSRPRQVDRYPAGPKLRWVLEIGG